MGGTSPTHSNQEAFTMRSYTPPAGTRFYAGVDLHARAVFLVILDADGHIRFARNLPAAPEPFLRAVAPFRDGLVVACECLFCWYWLADLCATEKIAFVLGHALYMKAIHGGKSADDRIDSQKIAQRKRVDLDRPGQSFDHSLAIRGHARSAFRLRISQPCIGNWRHEAPILSWHRLNKSNKRGSSQLPTSRR
jgi:hypothetical protein